MLLHADSIFARSPFLRMALLSGCAHFSVRVASMELLPTASVCMVQASYGFACTDTLVPLHHAPGGGRKAADSAEKGLGVKHTTLTKSDRK